MGETHDFGFAKWILRQDTKRYEQQEKNRYRGPHQDEKLVQERGITEQKDSPQNGRKYVQSIYAEYKYIPRLSNKITITK